LVGKVMKNHKFFDESRSNMEERQEKIDLIKVRACSILHSNGHIQSVNQLKIEVESLYEIKVSTNLVRKVLREDLKWRYRRLKRIPYQGNSERCLIQR
jgi:hypothetical protein